MLENLKPAKFFAGRSCKAVGHAASATTGRRPYPAAVAVGHAASATAGKRPAAGKAVGHAASATAGRRPCLDVAGRVPALPLAAGCRHVFTKNFAAGGPHMSKIQIYVHGALFTW
jgi:hypothetical protein